MRLEQDKVNRSLRLSIYDGAFASAMLGLSQEYFAPFLISIGATVRQIGILSAVPSLIASLIQLKSAEVTDFIGSRKKVLNIFVFLQALMLVFMSVMVVYGGSVYLFIGLVTLFTSFGAFATPAWGSLMSDLVPENRRGVYFGSRNMITGLVAIATIFLAGLMLNHLRQSHVALGFALIFGFAFIFRIISWIFLKLMYEPLFIQGANRGFTFMNFVSSIRGNTFSKFVISVSLMNFSVNLSSPFISVLLLRESQYSYILYTAVIVTGGLVVFLTMRRWGRHADYVGNIKIIKSTSLLISIIPFLWIVSRNPVFLIFVQIFAGIVWSGFNLSASNFVYDAVPSHERMKNIAYFNVINGLSIFAGAMTGGMLFKYLPPVSGSKILTLFFLSAVLRFAVSFFMLLRLQEVRHVVNVKNIDLFSSIVGIRPLFGEERKIV